MENPPQLHLVHTRDAIPLTLMLALWHEMTMEWRPEEASPMPVAMPLLNSKVALHVLLEMPTKAPTGRAYSLDVVCRIASCRCDIMQTTNPFFDANKRWLRKLDKKILGRSPSLPVNHAALTDEALAVWAGLTPAEREAAIGEARRVLEGDIESGGQICAVLPPTPCAATPHSQVAPAGDSVAGSVAQIHADQGLPQLVSVGDLAASLVARIHVNPGASVASVGDLAASLVAQIHVDPIQPQYRKQPYGPALQGWPARLRAYFWPAPAQGYRQVSAGLTDLLAESEALARVLTTHGGWDNAQQQRAIRLALRIFEWGGVKQDPATVTAANVKQVFEDALANNARSKAPMNSGWTKVAAFATAHQESGGQPQVIWDSRVATAIIARLDRLLPEDNLPSNDVPGIGMVPGRGGTRPRELSRKWPRGYQRWDSQVAGSELVRRMRDVLNDFLLNDSSPKYPPMPLPEGGVGRWTTRGVEMVLFMDGY